MNCDNWEWGFEDIHIQNSWSNTLETTQKGLLDTF